MIALWAAERCTAMDYMDGTWNSKAGRLHKANYLNDLGNGVTVAQQTLDLLV